LIDYDIQSGLTVLICATRPTEINAELADLLAGPAQ
jgi:hypothetical protein